MKTHSMYLASLHTIYIYIYKTSVNYHFASHKTITGKVENNNDGWQLLIPFTTMAVQTIIDIAIWFANMKEPFSPWSIGRFIFKHNTLRDNSSS
jgi:hypothetical protein